MRVHFVNRKGTYDRWVEMEEVAVFIGQDGSAMTSLPDAYANERLLTSEQTELAIQDFTQGEN